MASIRRLALLGGLAVALALGGCGGDDDGDGNGNGNGGGCEGANATLLGSCIESNGSCWEARGTYPGDFDVEADCTDSDGGTWSAGTTCPSSAKASGGCVMNTFGAIAVTWVSDADAAEWQPICEGFGGCYLAP